MTESEKITHPIQLAIIETLAEAGPMPRRDLVQRLNIPRTTIYDNLSKLQKKQIVEKYDKKLDHKPGRPVRFWKLNGGQQLA